MTFSINTNVGAQIALQSLGVTSSQLAATEKQISTGYRVADATDDGAAYAVAQGVRATVGALTSANQQLGNVNGLLTTTLTGLNSASNTINDLNAVLVKLSDGNTQGSQRTQYQAQYNTDISELKTQLNGANYNGKTLIGNVGGAPAGVTFGRTAVVQDQIGTTYGIATFSGNSLYTSLNVTTFTSTAASSRPRRPTASAPISGSRPSVDRRRMPSCSSPSPSSRAEAIMPSETCPYVVRAEIGNGPGKIEPGSVTTTLSPTKKLSAPQTIPRTSGPPSAAVSPSAATRT